MHERSYCHLDLSLENTMLFDVRALRVKLIDLGLTQHFPNRDFRIQKRVGKQQYMAPEVYARKVYNAKAADVHCLGVMLFMMLVGAPPFTIPCPRDKNFNCCVAGHIAHVEAISKFKRLRLLTAEALDL